MDLKSFLLGAAVTLLMLGAAAFFRRLRDSSDQAEVDEQFDPEAFEYENKEAGQQEASARVELHKRLGLH